MLRPCGENRGSGKAPLQLLEDSRWFAGRRLPRASPGARVSAAPSPLQLRERCFAPRAIDGAAGAADIGIVGFDRRRQDTGNDSREAIMKICTYVNAHHEDFGVALFVLPVTLLGLAVAGLAYGISLLLG